MLQEVASLGFEWVELSHGIRISLVPGILRALGEGVIRVSSTHNFCPLPTGFTSPAPNIYMPSTADHREHSQWLRQTKRTLDFAQQVGARVVVMHLGQVDFFWFSPLGKYRKYLKAKGDEFSADAPEYKELLAKTLRRIRKCATAPLARVTASLEEILPYAAERGLRLGLENRERIEELPLDDGFPDLFASLSEQGVAGYWHDCGHAQIKQRGGLTDHARQLEQNADHLVGFHLHDIDASGRDHQPVGTGSIDFGMVSRFFRPEHVLVLEYGPRVTPAAVLESKQRIEALIPPSTISL